MKLIKLILKKYILGLFLLLGAIIGVVAEPADAGDPLAHVVLAGCILVVVPLWFLLIAKLDTIFKKRPFLWRRRNWIAFFPWEFLAGDGGSYWRMI